MFGLQLTVFKNCFADIRLPFSAVRSEELELKVVVFNYHDSEQAVKNLAPLALLQSS